jgi:NAD(P)-dependent dehydrogenase (short-subunit alcohol dehydrogenase family)
MSSQPNVAPRRDLFDLTGRVALVTGGARGVGRMIAEGLVAHGARVYITSRDRVAGETAARQMCAAGGECRSLVAELVGVAGARALADALREREPALHVLVHNAGVAEVAAFEHFTELQWDRVMDVNVRAPFFVTQALLDLLCAGASRERPAKVIHVSSVDAIGLNACEAYSYGASKAALNQLTRQLAARLIARNIVVSAIAPGAFASDMNRAARDRPERLATRVPAGRIGTPDDIAGAAIYLASRAGDYVVGGTLVVDGGFAYALPTHGQPLEGA